MLVQLRTRVYLILQWLRLMWLRKVWGMNLGFGVRISGKARLDYSYPKALHIGDYTILTPGVQVFTHDFVTRRHEETRIGSHCFVGANAIILCGVTIGDRCVIAAGSVVTEDVPARSMVAGNPAKIVKSGIRTGRYGRTVPWAKDYD
jgi:acetyltransferase-like isoleucine patch superfamily enzyme